MEKQNKSNKAGEKTDEINVMDQGFNVIVQTVNRATGLDKSNDGKAGNKKK